MTNVSALSRPFRPESDIPPLMALLATIAAGGGTGAVIDEADVRAQLAWRGHDPARDRWVAEAPGDSSRFCGHAWLFTQSPEVDGFVKTGNRAELR